MFKYEKEIVELKDPQPFDILVFMKNFGLEGWDIFSITEKTIEKWESYGQPHKLVEFTLYMKRNIIIS